MMKEIVGGLIAPLRNMYIGFPIVICSVAFGFCILWDVKKNAKMFLIAGAMIYVVGATIMITTSIQALS